MPPREDHIAAIRRLCSFEGRVAGTDAERRAAGEVAARLRQSGRRAEVEPIHVNPQVWASYALHCLLGIAGSLLAVGVPPAGFALVLAAATSLYLDLNTRLPLLRRLFFRRASQNVYSPAPRGGSAARVVLCAHLDAARSGYLFGKGARRVERLVPPRLRMVLSPPRLMFWSLVALLPLLGARMAGVEADWLSALQLLPTIVLIVAAYMAVDIQLSAPVLGANDNAAGAALALSLAEALDSDPPEHLAVDVLLTGGGECGMQGMRSFLRTHRNELDRAGTRFIAIEHPGGEALHYLTAEGLAVTYAHDARLAELCEAVALAGAERGGEPSARPAGLATGTSALPPILAGYSAIAICGLSGDGLLPTSHHTRGDTPEALDPKALEHAERFTLDLVRALDSEVGRTL